MDGKLKAYQTADTLGKSQLDLIIKVYDGAITSLRQTREQFEKEEYNNGRIHLEKANKFVTHLFTTLDMEKGGEIAEQLSKLYAFTINQMNVIDATKDLNAIDENITVLSNLRDGWVDLKTAQQEQIQENNSDEQKQTQQEQTINIEMSA
ncbi:MAG: flagellar export chaperone FliS [Calditrichaeota bacterium]|nr:MAG: flagellar export chaperone FliS [Calditrichota bacterium]